MAGSGPDLAAAYCCTNRTLGISNSSCNFVFSSTLSKYTASYPKQLLHVLRGHPFGKEPELLLAEAQLDGLVTSSGFGLLVRPGSPGSRLARLPGEGGQYAKTTNTQIFSRHPTIDFPTHQNATQIRSY
jgi:hypothetical protein